ncbi:MAG TPA: SDR family NAD(P)-dependent oxidoreductase [Phycisphaerales bacterium]|nr:SDR family NAD(P)-dependent oxidoreductase [Phycisphaerales bacterium]
MSIDLSGRPIAITGASSGIGAATAIACARAGMPVALGARRTDKLDAIAAQIRAAGGRALTLAADVTRPEDCKALVDACVREFGSIYAVYANAGYGEESALHLMPDERVRAMFETNFFGSLNVIRPALEHMLRNPGPPSQPRGHILWCSSCLARMSLPNYSIYCATKASQAHAATAMRHELRPQGVHVSSVHPIGTRTEFFEQVQRRAGGERTTITLPRHFYQTPEFVAKKTVQCLRRPRGEVWTGLSGVSVRTAMALAAMFPGMADWALARISRKS